MITHVSEEFTAGMAPGPDPRCPVRHSSAGIRLSPGCPHLDLGFGEQLSVGKKGAQTREVGIAWIWVEDFGIHALNPFTNSPLFLKITTLDRLASDALADYPRVAGIAWFRGGKMLSSPRHRSLWFNTPAMPTGPMGRLRLGEDVSARLIVVLPRSNRVLTLWRILHA